jgi:hypothetical protein
LDPLNSAGLYQTELLTDCRIPASAALPPGEDRSSMAGFAPILGLLLQFMLVVIVV